MIYIYILCFHLFPLALQLISCPSARWIIVNISPILACSKLTVCYGKWVIEIVYIYLFKMVISHFPTVNVYQCSVGLRSHPVSGPCAAKALATLPGRSSWPASWPALLGHRMIPWEPQIASFAAAWKSRFPGDPMGGSPIETYWNLHLRYLWRTSSTLFNCCEFEIDYLTWRQIEPAIWDFRKDL